VPRVPSKFVEERDEDIREARNRFHWDMRYPGAPLLRPAGALDGFPERRSLTALTGGGAPPTVRWTGWTRSSSRRLALCCPA